MARILDGVDAYEAHRLQLAELAIMFDRQTHSTPGLYWQFLESDECWSEFISANRSSRNGAEEIWDIYPLDWCWAEGEESPFDETDVSQYCARYVSSGTYLTVARQEFERLAQMATKALMAIGSDLERIRGAKNVPAVLEGADVRLGWHLPRGYRGFLDAVRNTAELHQSPLLSVRHGLWGTLDAPKQEKEILMACLAAAAYGDDSPHAAPLVTEVVQDIRIAACNAIRLWLEAITPSPVDHIVYDFDPIALPGTRHPDPALARLGLAESLHPTESQRIASARNRRRGRRPMPKEVQAKDRKMYEAWKTGMYKTYESLGREFNVTEDVVSRVIGRQVKRIRRSERKTK